MIEKSKLSDFSVQINTRLVVFSSRVKKEYYTTNSSNNIPPSPATEIILSITVHERKVCFIDKLKNSLNIQNPESFTWEPKTLPVPTANTISSGDAAPDATGPRENKRRHLPAGAESGDVLICAAVL